MFTTFPASGSADVRGYVVSPANAYCIGSSKRTARRRAMDNCALGTKSTQVESLSSPQSLESLLA